MRTAHLERAHQLRPAKIIYQVRRYDFDEELAAGLDLLQATPVGASRWLLTHRVTKFEINEPLMLSSVRSTALALIALRLRQFVTGERAQVLTYAIGNADPFSQSIPRKLKTRLGRRLDRFLAVQIWLRIDRVAFGTPGAATVYDTVLPSPSPGLVAEHIFALPAPEHATAPPKVQDSIVYLGAFVDRKGFRKLLDGISELESLVPTVSIALVGKGHLEQAARAASEDHPRVELFVDPPRAIISEILAKTQVLVLPSQSTAGWREQVGLPIVEGLAHGCTVVTSTETGLADWLTAQGHHVLDPSLGAQDLASQIATALNSPLDPADVLASLPVRDGRLQADDWLFH